VDWTRILVVRCLHAGLTLAYMVVFAIYRTLPDTSDFCAPYHNDAAGCAAWPNLTQSSCDRLAQMSSTPSWRTVPSGRVLPTAYRCRFVQANTTLDAVLAGEEARLLLPSPTADKVTQCLKAECALFQNALSIALEFGTLLAIAAYAATYALPDAQWILEHAARAPSEPRAVEQRIGLLAPYTYPAAAAQTAACDAGGVRPITLASVHPEPLADLPQNFKPNGEARPPSVL
jgi:hypothetical protein